MEEEFDYIKDHFEWLKKEGVIEDFEVLDPEDVDLQDVIVYSMKTCSYCNEAKSFLDENGIEYQDIDVNENPDEYEYMKGLTGQQRVPVFDISGEIIVGYNKKKLKEVLGID